MATNKTDLEAQSSATNPQAPKDISVERKPSLIWRMLVNIKNFTCWITYTFYRGFRAGFIYTILFDFLCFYTLRPIFGGKGEAEPDASEA